MTVDHVRFDIEDTGLHIHPQWPYLGPTPDGLVQCSYCGLGVCEVKCPFDTRHLTIEEAVKTHHFCQVTDGNSYHLFRNHPYYYQIQAQLHITSRDYCDFVMWTTKGLFIQRLEPDIEMWDEAVENGTMAQIICICGHKLRTKIITCASTDCKVKFYHLKCVDLRRTPKLQWICNECENKEN